jgi:hypothetical protein
MSSSKSNHSRGRSSRNDRNEAKRVLRKAMKRRMVGLDASRAVGWQVIKLPVRIERILDHVDTAYAGQPFLLGFPPDAPANRNRFNAYVHSHAQAMKLHRRAIELWMLVFGMKKEDNWTPLLTESMRQAAATPIVSVRHKS